MPRYRLTLRRQGQIIGYRYPHRPGQLEEAIARARQDTTHRPDLLEVAESPAGPGPPSWQTVRQIPLTPEVSDGTD